MPISTGIKTTGGAKLRAVLAKAEQPRRSKVTVGIFPGSKYPDGTPVAACGRTPRIRAGAASARKAMVPAVHSGTGKGLAPTS